MSTTSYVKFHWKVFHYITSNGDDKNIDNNNKQSDFLKSYSSAIYSTLYWFATIHSWCQVVQLSRWQDRQREEVCFILDVEMEGLGEERVLGPQGKTSPLHSCADWQHSSVSVKPDVCATTHPPPSQPLHLLFGVFQVGFILCGARGHVSACWRRPCDANPEPPTPPKKKKEGKKLHTGSSWGVGVEGGPQERCEAHFELFSDVSESAI